MATMAAPSTRGASLDGSTNNPPFQNVIEPETTPADQRRYRKEGKGWSGEWNIKDMERVANALRGLKARWAGFNESSSSSLHRYYPVGLLLIILP
jgi:hypothetical protein